MALTAITRYNSVHKSHETNSVLAQVQHLATNCRKAEYFFKNTVFIQNSGKDHKN